MAAGVTFVVGRSGSGKSRALRDMAKELHSAGEQVVFIVPEQFTFETERRLAEELGGLMGVSVYSFASLAETALKNSGKVFLSPQGRSMAVRKTVLENQSDLQVFARVKDKAGFAKTLHELFTMFKRFEVSPGRLKEASKELEDTLLGRKLSELALLYEKTENHLSSRYMDTEDLYRALIEQLPSSQFANTHIIIDGFDNLTEQLYKIMEALMEIASGVAMSFRLDHNSANCRDGHVFAPELRAYSRLHQKAEELGCKIVRRTLPDDSIRPRQGDKVLSHLEKEAFAYPFNVYQGNEEITSLRLFAATSIPAECDMAADGVLKAVQDGMRFRDIAVVVTDPAYQLPLARAFRARNIPFFSDASHPLSDYAAPRLLLAALKFCRSYSGDSLMEMIRTGLCGVSREDGDIFENYCLSHGIRRTAFTEAFKGNDLPEEAERVRETIVPPLMELKGELAASPTAGGKAEALFRYMQKLELYQRTVELCDALKQEGRQELMEENAQVYRNILTVLDQLFAIMGESRMGLDRFAQVLEEGFEAYEISAIPATVDQVLMGSINKTRLKNVRALFILGANEGCFPMNQTDDGMINDSELDKLCSLGLNRWDGAKERSSSALMNVYVALSLPRELLCLSYTMSAGGDGALPSPVIDRIREIFPTLALHTDLESRSPLCPTVGYRSLAEGLRSYADTKLPAEGLSELYAWYCNPLYQDRVELLESALYYRCSPEPFGHELSLQLYGDALYGSATRLENYNRCPFSHFVTYGLKAAERKEYRERRVDEGTFCHQALDEFIKIAMKRGIRDITPADIEDIFRDILPNLAAEHNFGVLLSSRRNEALYGRLCRTVKATARAIVKQAQAGGFTPASSEVIFGHGRFPAIELALPTGERFLVSGRIDRIDKCTIDGQEYYRVVDYKSSDKGFDYGKLYHGLDLQLPLYIAAVSAVEKTARAAGMYYMKMDDPTTEDGDDSIEKKLMKAFRLSGLTLSDPEIVSATAGDDPDGKVISTGPNAKGFVVENELERIVGYAKKKAGDTLKDIYGGGAAVSPGEFNKATPCTYCPNRSVCCFDSRFEDCDVRKLSGFDKEAFFSLTEKEDDAR